MNIKRCNRCKQPYDENKATVDDGNIFTHLQACYKNGPDLNRRYFDLCDTCWAKFFKFMDPYNKREEDIKKSDEFWEDHNKTMNEKIRSMAAAKASEAFLKDEIDEDVVERTCLRCVDFTECCSDDVHKDLNKTCENYRVTFIEEGEEENTNENS